MRVEQQRARDVDENNLLFSTQVRDHICQNDAAEIRSCDANLSPKRHNDLLRLAQIKASADISLT
jgi:hypothetical protein